MSGVSVKQPLSINNTDGAYALNKTIYESAAQNLRTLVLTIPGERMMDPDFGVGLRDYLFEQDTPTLKSSIRSVINNQVSRYIPFINIRGVNVVTPEDTGTNILSVTINYSINNELVSTIITAGV